MNFDPAQLKGYLDLIYTVGTIISAVGLLYWRIAKSAARNKAAFRALQKQVATLIEVNRNFGKDNHELSKQLVSITTKLDEREKDINKLEGALEASRKDIVLLVSSLQQTTSSLDAMWRTLQKLFPDQVRQRLSDKSLA